MRKLVRIAVVLVIIIGAALGIASAKTLYVVAENQINNATQTPADVFSVNVKLTTYNNQCMALTFSSMAAVAGIPPFSMAFVPEIDGSLASPTTQGAVYFLTSIGSHWDMAAFTWFRCGLNIGNHSVTIRYLPVDPGNIAYLGGRLLKIDIKAGKIVPPLAGAEFEDELTGAELED
jgi:hypothetical protein